MVSDDKIFVALNQLLVLSSGCQLVAYHRKDYTNICFYQGAINNVFRSMTDRPYLVADSAGQFVTSEYPTAGDGGFITSAQKGNCYTQFLRGLQKSLGRSID